MQILEDEFDVEDLYLYFAEFEEFCKEFERARAIYKYALDHVPKGRADVLYARFVKFEKQHGDRESIEEVLSAKKRLQVRCCHSLPLTHGLLFIPCELCAFKFFHTVSISCSFVFPCLFFSLL
jgi:hypothetical protein